MQRLTKLLTIGLLLLTVSAHADEVKIQNIDFDLAKLPGSRTTANRWCHSALSQTLVNAIFGKDGSPVAKAVAEGFVWAPKEFFYDMNPSAHDLTFTYRDSFGTERSTFEITVYGDAIFDNHVNKVQLGKGSLPFVTWRRALFGKSK